MLVTRPNDTARADASRRAGAAGSEGVEGSFAHDRLALCLPRLWVTAEQLTKVLSSRAGQGGGGMQGNTSTPGVPRMHGSCRFPDCRKASECLDGPRTPYAGGRSGSWRSGRCRAASPRRGLWAPEDAMAEVLLHVHHDQRGLDQGTASSPPWGAGAGAGVCEGVLTTEACRWSSRPRPRASTASSAAPPLPARGRRAGR